MRNVMIVLSLLVLAMPIRADAAPALDERHQMVSLSREGGPDEATMVFGLNETLARATLDQDDVALAYSAHRLYDRLGTE